MAVGSADLATEAVGSEMLTVGSSEAIPDVVIAVDPGRGKCGLAAVDSAGRVMQKAVVPAAEIAEAVARLLEAHPDATVVLGDRTGAAEIGAMLTARCRVSPVLVEEHHSTLEGRRRYFEENPPRGWRRLLPLGLQTPPRPYDDYVAIVLAERYLTSLGRR
jgi:RNase H-fold protein (predicted Holliday junction resolvase)